MQNRELFSRHRRLLALLLIPCLAGIPSTIKAAQQRRPNFLLLISDDQRPDTIRALGNPIIETPHLDRLVHSGLTFTRATCAHPLCVPSRAELLTGCIGFRNGVHPPHNKPDLTLPTWPKVMAAAGYNTYHVGKWMISGRPSTRGFQESLGLFASGKRPTTPQFDSAGREVTGYRGWMFQTDDRRLRPEQGVGLTADISAKFADAAIEFISRKSDKPFFLQVNFTAPHDPLLDPPGWLDKYPVKDMPLPKNFMERHPFDHGNFAGRDEKLNPWPRKQSDIRRDLATYYRVISDMDAQIGRIVAALTDHGKLDNTVIIFTSDHGLAIGSHGLMGKQNMYEHTIGVPLIFSGPGIPKNKLRTAQIYLRDLFPTTCELAHVPIPKTVQGHSFKAVIEGREKKIYDHVFGYFHDKQRMVRTDRWKLIYYPHLQRHQLFDLQNDPDELKDLNNLPAHRDIKGRLKAVLLRWQQQVQDPLIQ
jgi:arylsulfatase A-like enzyme